MSRQNAYHERVRKHEAAVRERGLTEREVRRINADRLMRGYEAAYLAANGRELRLTYHSGWARSKDIAKPLRISDLQRMTDNLWARVHETELGEAE